MSTTLHPSEADDVSGELTEHAEGADVLADEPLEAGVVVTPAGGAVAVLRRGIKASPELRVGFRITVLMAVITAIGRIIIPVLIQQILDKGILTDGGFNASFTFGACGLALAITIGVTVLGRTTYIRLVTAAETMLRSLRVRAFAHIHSLSVADHNEAKRGVLTSAGDERYRDDRSVRAMGSDRLDRQLRRDRRRPAGDGGLQLAAGSAHRGRAVSVATADASAAAQAAARL